MKHAVALLAFLISSSLWAADECTFDQENQLAVLAAIAKQNPGAKSYPEKRQVVWVRPGEGTTTFGYGGCADLGSVVTRSMPLSAARTQEKVFSLARDLATQFWSNKEVSERLATETLVKALQSGRFYVETVEGKKLFQVNDPNFVQLYVEHEYKDGVDTIAIGWQGNF
jgi:hypothetical protein